MIDASISAVLRSRYTIRRFFVLYGAILIAALVMLAITTASFDANSNFRAIVTGFLGNFAAAVAIFILTYGFYVFVTPPGLRNAEVLPLRSGEIAEEIINLAVGSSDYWFWGRSGSYFRSTVLPQLDEAARKERRHVTVRIVMPDPDGPGNATRYAAMKRGLGEDADEHTLPANVIATVVATAIAAARNPYLHAQIALCATVPVLRYDISRVGALITRDARNLPAILVNANNPYFEMFRDAIENELAQSRTVSWDETMATFHRAGAVSVEDALSAMRGVPSADPAVIGIAEGLLASKTHRYATATIIDAAKTFLESKFNRDAR